MRAGVQCALRSPTFLDRFRVAGIEWQRRPLAPLPFFCVPGKCPAPPTTLHPANLMRVRRRRRLLACGPGSHQAVEHTPVCGAA